jgi:phosphohistidine phosphatase
VCSDARRARQTWDLVAPELGGKPAVRFEPRAYAASAMTLLYLAQELPSRYRTAMLIAHNPGLSELASQLAAPPDTGPEIGTVTDNGPRPGIGLPTAAVAVFEFPGDWPSLTLGQARLVSLTAPADLRAG